jgi:hypothetical protein
LGLAFCLPIVLIGATGSNMVAEDEYDLLARQVFDGGDLAPARPDHSIVEIVSAARR